MLNGIAPILIFSFPPTINLPTATDPGLPLSVRKALGAIGGIPIPIYLDEKLTGIYVVNEEKNVDMDTQPYQAQDGTTFVKQRGVNNTVNINFLASQDSILLSVLLAFSDELFKRAVNGLYSVSYFNKGTLVFGGLIHSFSDQSGSDDTLRRISMSIVKTNQITINASVLPPSGAPATAVLGSVKGPAQ